MPSNMALYFKEKDGIETIENDKGFMTYRINGNECYIVDVFIREEYRNTGLAVEMENMIIEDAKEKGCTYLLGAVQRGIQAEETNKQFLKHNGYRYIGFKEEDEIHYFIKDL